MKILSSSSYCKSSDRNIYKSVNQINFQAIDDTKVIHIGKRKKSYYFDLIGKMLSFLLEAHLRSKV